MSKKKRRDIPCFNTPIIETLAIWIIWHPKNFESTLNKSREVGVERIVTIAVSAQNLSTVRELTQNYPQIWGTQGIHPHEAESFTPAVALEIRQHATDERILAIGEIGLDYYYDHADRAIQRSVFEQQLQIAAELDMPVVIHTREADEDTRDILKNYSSLLSRKGVIHSFTSSLALAEFCLAEGFALGFNGIATFNRAENVREVIAATPVEQLLLETDAPYLTPVPYRGRPNAPYYLPFIAEQVATVKAMPIEELLQQAYSNSLELFSRAVEALIMLRTHCLLQIST